MKQNPEALYYENPQLWTTDHWKSHMVDMERVNIASDWIPKDCQIILDVGCGNGIFISSLPKEVNVIGLERSWAAIQSAKLPLIQGDGVNLPFSNKSFDIVTCMEVLEHLPYHNYRTTLAELLRVSRCYILVTVPFCENLFYSQIPCPQCGCIFHPNYHMRSYNISRIKNLFHHFKGVRMVKHKAIVKQYSQKRFEFVWNLFRLYLHRSGRNFPDKIICPQCGYRNPINQRQILISNEETASLKLKPSRFWPTRKTYIWWMALYKKEEC